MSFPTSNSIDDSPPHSIKLKSYNGQWGLRWPAYVHLSHYLFDPMTYSSSYSPNPAQLDSLLALRLSRNAPTFKHTFPKIATWLPPLSSSVLCSYIIVFITTLLKLQLLSSFPIPFLILLNSTYDHLTYYISIFYCLLECSVYYFTPMLRMVPGTK